MEKGSGDTRRARGGLVLRQQSWLPPGQSKASWELVWALRGGVGGVPTAAEHAAGKLLSLSELGFFICESGAIKIMPASHKCENSRLATSL